jgi:hypothetical protein
VEIVAMIIEVAVVVVVVVQVMVQAEIIVLIHIKKCLNNTMTNIHPHVHSVVMLFSFLLLF